MAKNNEIVESLKTTFYIYDEEGKLYKKEKKIWSPFNVATFNPRDPKFDVYNDPRVITFIDWVYETDNKEDIEFLSVYNTWWMLSNWKKWKWDWIQRVLKEKIQEKTKTQTVTEKIEVPQIPMVVAETLTVSQLKDLCLSWDITLPNTCTKTDIIKLLLESWNLSK